MWTTQEGEDQGAGRVMVGFSQEGSLGLVGCKSIQCGFGSFNVRILMGPNKQAEPQEKEWWLLTMFTKQPLWVKPKLCHLLWSNLEK